MTQASISFRPATPADAPFVATVMMEAVEVPMMEEGRTPDEGITAICRRTDTLYSWRNATIAEADGCPIGALIAYSGKGYHDIKVFTFSLVRDRLSFDPERMDDETREGEYYLDSLAILPEWRGRGIGTALLRRGIDTAREMGLTPVLACDPANTPAFTLYTLLGFRTTGDLFIFGEHYDKMELAQ